MLWGMKDMEKTGGNRIEQIAKRIAEDTRGRSSPGSMTVNHQPDKDAVVSVLNKLQKVLFPANFLSREVGNFALEYELCSLIGEIYVTLVEQITLALVQSKIHGAENERGRRDRAKEIAERSLKIAGSICIYTSENITVEEL